MLLLTSTSDKIRLTTGSALTVDVHASWVDNLGGTITPGRTNTAITTATTTDIVASPASSTQRNIKALSIRNKDASSDVVTVLHTDGTTPVQLISCTLLTGEELCYDAESGWKHFSASGGLKFDPYPLIADGHTLANTSGATASPVDTGLSAYIDYVFGSTQGSLLYRGSATWTTLGPGTVGQTLLTGGAAANPVWQNTTGIVPTAPGGRLSLQSGVAVQFSAVAGATSIFYVLYRHAYVPIFSGSNWIAYLIPGTQLTLTLSASAHLANNTFDIFAFSNGGTLTLGAGPAWTNITTRSASLSQGSVSGGIWTNSATITLTNGASTFSGITAGQATWLGSFFTAANGQCTHHIGAVSGAGGANAIMGLYNYYNRLIMVCKTSDTTASWTYAVNAWRNANNSSSNRVTWVDGIGQSPVTVTTQITVNGIPNTGYGGAVLDQTAASPSQICCLTTATSSTLVREIMGPGTGLHFAQAVENTVNGSVTFFGSGFQELIVELEM